jgi:tRNA (uracil-5-)-methyltransferase
MLSYDVQLDLKRNVVVKAYRNFSGLCPVWVRFALADVLSGLPETAIPPIQSTMASPLQYGYRTKITPHFEAPPKKFQKKKGESVASDAEKPDWLKIGFNHIGKRQVMDIEVGSHVTTRRTRPETKPAGMPYSHACIERSLQPHAWQYHEVWFLLMWYSFD